MASVRASGPHQNDDALRVGFDGHAFSSPAGGVRRYVTELTSALAECFPAVQLFAIGAGHDVALPSGVSARPAGSWMPTNLGWSLEGLPRASRRADLDVFHAPAYTTPLWGVRPLVVTIHDVVYERHPEWYAYRGGRVRRAFYRRCARMADLVITDSEFSRKEIVAAYGIPDERIRVIPLGVGAPFLHGGSGTSQADGDAPFILHLGDLHPRRNVELLVEVLALLRAMPGTTSTLQLVLAGTDRGSRASIETKAAGLGLSSAVRFVSASNDPAVVALMRSARAFVYPSLYEGFGLPALEAMACGTPVVAAAAASMPEVVGNAGLLIDPHDPRGWRDALASILTSPSRTAALRDAGVARAATFTWKRTAMQTFEAYRAVAK